MANVSKSVGKAERANTIRHCWLKLAETLISTVALQSWINRLAFQCENTKNSFMYPT
jgi:hypothetical protein